jgi:hypothetical protein
MGPEETRLQAHCEDCQVGRSRKAGSQAEGAWRVSFSLMYGFSAVFRPVLFCSFLLLCLFFLILVFHPNKSNRWGEDPQLTKLFYNF